MECTGFGLNLVSGNYEFASLIVIHDETFWTTYGGDIAANSWYSGNAADDGANTRGWILGHFLDPSAGERSTKDLEVKWGIHPAGEQRAEWVTGDQRTTLVLLVQGHFHVKFREGDATLTKQGDYLVWEPGTDHSWRAESDSVVVTVRWPSLPH